MKSEVLLWVACGNCFDLITVRFAGARKTLMKDLFKKRG